MSVPAAVSSRSERLTETKALPVAHRRELLRSIRRASEPDPLRHRSISPGSAYRRSGRIEIQTGRLS